MTLNPKGGLNNECVREMGFREKDRPTFVQKSLRKQIKDIRDELVARLAEWRLSLSSWQALQKPGVNFAKNNGGGFISQKEREGLLNE